MTFEVYPLNPPALVARVHPVAVNGIAVVLIVNVVSAGAYAMTRCTIEIGASGTSFRADICDDASTGLGIHSFGEEGERRERGSGGWERRGWIGGGGRMDITKFNTLHAY